jgi:hypothetical protein
MENLALSLLGQEASNDQCLLAAEENFAGRNSQLFFSESQ